jgi:hypothetical protein
MPWQIVFKFILPEAFAPGNSGSAAMGAMGRATKDLRQFPSGSIAVQPNESVTEPWEEREEESLAPFANPIETLSCSSMAFTLKIAAT